MVSNSPFTTIYQLVGISPGRLKITFMQNIYIMKKFLTAIVFILFCSLGFAQTTSGKISVVVQSGKFTINKAVVTNGWKKDVVSVAINAEARRRAGFNTTHTYDNLGIVLFERNEDKLPSGIISEVQFFTASIDTNSVTPKGYFTGKMQIEELKISSNLSWQDIKDKLKDYKQTDSYMEHNYRLAYKGLYIYFQFDDDETTLKKISIGKDTRS